MSVTTTTPATQVAETQEASLLERVIDRMEAVVERRMSPPVQPMELRSFEELERWAERAARSNMVPKDYQGKPDNIILAVQMGSELGLRPMQSIQNIAIVNGRPSIWGDAMLALCMTHPLYAGVEERIEGEGDDMVAICVAQRRGDAPKSGRFSVADAKRAGLWGKDLYGKYPTRMLAMRARGFALRDAFPDKLRGLIATEEAMDYEPVSAAPPPAPVKPTVDRAREKAEALAARFREVKTAGDYYALLDEPSTQTAFTWLRTNRPELYEIVDVARNTASTTMQDVPDAAEVEGQ